jgi:TRAP-type C4-dicarboxylate transport system substrate-binding protein
VVGDLRAKGMTITEPDLAPFRAVVMSISPQFEKEIGKDVIRMVLDAK